MSNDKTIKQSYDIDFDMKEPYVFISYAHKDSKSVLPMIAELQKNYNVWYDDGIDPGTEWDENIAQHIENCNLFFACITKNYLDSSNCKDELDYARSLDKTRVLIYFEKVELPSGMKMRLNRLQNIHKYVYKTEEDFYKKLYQSEGLLECLKQTKPTTKPKKASKPKTEKNKPQQTDTDKKVVEPTIKQITPILFDNVANTTLNTESQTKVLTTCNSKKNDSYTFPPLSLLKDNVVIEDKDKLKE
ncbi:MAG: toll/interleukin-1 receptor domain-containing protein, partial [Clostridia bacterium]|nr:toll/interleukin-1 receptor domain-containing protein [Clostridia bacterium]